MPGRVAAVTAYVAANAYVLYLLHLVPLHVLGYLYGFYLGRFGWAGEIAQLALGLAFPLVVVTLIRKVTSGRLKTGRSLPLLENRL
jgi:hypothetical protein